MYFIHNILTNMFRPSVPAIFRVMFLLQEYESYNNSVIQKMVEIPAETRRWEYCQYIVNM